MKLQTPVDKVFMVGPVYAKRLAKLEIFTIEDLFHHFPSRFEDYSSLCKINRLHPGQTVTIQGIVEQMKNEYTKGGKKIQRAVVTDETGTLEIIWFNQIFLVKAIRAGESYNFSGKADWFGHKIVMMSPEYEMLHKTLDTSTSEESLRDTIRGENDQQVTTIHTGRLVPVYPETYGVSSKWLRSRIAPLLREFENSLTEYLPSSVVEENHLLDYQTALLQMHFPENLSLSQLARDRLAFDELFLIQLASLKRKAEWEKETVGHQFQIKNSKLKIQNFIDKLPFKLTTAQNRVIDEILTDLGKNQPMNRLLEGDVGSGKTVVAAIAMYVAYLNGFQSLIMAPTEILANQHYQTLKSLLEPFGLKIGLITKSSKFKVSRLSGIPQAAGQSSKFDIFVGTHALLNEKIHYKKVGLAIIDEQHRFGVEQRTKLKEKGINPHLLTLTATPIPRTVALTLYGELDLSFLDQMPLGRTKVKTWVVPQEKRKAAYEWIRKQVKTTAGQVFIICPLIEESETLITIKAATKEYEYLKKEVFPDLALGLLHGRLKTKEKEATLQEFRSGKLDILVATPVVEVGLDIPNAQIMMIEGAERFGLAQLHQLRGRVGRSDKTSFCLLFTNSETERLKAMEKIYVGAQLAELDLKLRGPGEIFGTAQHGLPDLQVAKLTDLNLIEKTRQAAKMLLQHNSTLAKFPLLQEKLNRYTIKSVNPD